MILKLNTINFQLFKLKKGIIQIEVLLLLLSVFFFMLDAGAQQLERNPPVDCSNPLSKTLDYNAFIKNNSLLINGDTEGPIATGNDLAIGGIITVAAQTPGTYRAPGDVDAASLIVGNKIQYVEGQGVHLNNGILKIANLDGTNIYTTDANNAQSNLRATAGGYESFPRIQLQRMQSQGSVGEDNAIDFDQIFLGLEGLSNKLAATDPTVTITDDYKIDLISGRLNVLTISDQALLELPYISFNQKPDADTPLVINVEVHKNFDWNIFNMAGIGDHEGAHIIWNFNTSFDLQFTGGGTIIGSILAPSATVIKNNSGNINGQVIAKDYQHLQGELHYHVFDNCITTDECSVVALAEEDQTIKAGEEVVLTASGGDSYLWSTGETTSAITVTPMETTTYTVTVFEGECQDTAAVTITVLGCDLSLEVPESFSICKGESVSIEAIGNGVFSWSTGDTGTSIEVSPMVSTTYTVTLTESEKCFVTKEIYVEVIDFIADAGEDQEICASYQEESIISKYYDEVILTASEGDAYLWSTGDTTRSISVYPDETTTYEVLVTYNGCQDSDTVTVYVIGCEDELTSQVYPTVLKDKNTIRVNYRSSKSTDLYISLISLQGETVSEKSYALKKGMNTIDFNLDPYHNLSEGLYLLKTRERSNTKTTKILIKR